MATVLIAVALGLYLFLHPYVSGAFVVIFLAAVMIVGWFGRTGRDMFSVAISTLADDYN